MKKLLYSFFLVPFFLAFSSNAYASETGLILGSNTTGSFCMASLDNIYVQDESGAQPGCGFSVTEILRVNTFDISSIPSGSVITGVKVVARIINFNGDDDPNVNYTPYVNVDGTCAGTGALISEEDIVWNYKESLIDVSSCGLTDSTDSVNYITLTDYDLSNNAGVFDVVGIKVVYQAAPTSTPTPTSTPEVKIAVSPTSGSKTVGVPYTVTVSVNSGGQSFNAARANVAVNSNLTVTGINTPSSNACNFVYTKTPTTQDPSFAGAITSTSSNGCNVYTMTLIPNAAGTGTVVFNNSSIKAYSDGSEILTGVENGSFTLTAPTPTATPPGTTLVTVDDSVQGSGQNQWNYNGGWSHCVDSGNPACNPNSIYNTSVSWDNTTNDYATVTFTGTRIILYGLVDPNHGTGAVSIDGGTETTVDFHAGTRTGNVLLWTSPILTPGVHTFKIRVADGYIVPDRVDILQTSPSGLTVTNTSFDTYGSSFTLLGTKDASLTSIFVNNSSANASYPTSTTWQSVESLVLGNNAFVIYGKDANNVQTASINVTINRHTLGDINGDGLVDLTDVSLFAVDWDKTDNLTYNLSDMNGDSNVNLTDLSILAKLEQ